jgi:hypothetical protein
MTGGLGRKKMVTVPTTSLQLVLFVCIFVAGQAVVMGVSCSRSCAQEELQQPRESRIWLQQQLSLQSSKGGLIFSNASRSMYAASCILSFRCRDNYCNPPMSTRFILSSNMQVDPHRKSSLICRNLAKNVESASRNTASVTTLLLLRIL